MICDMITLSTTSTSSSNISNCVPIFVSTVVVAWRWHNLRSNQLKLIVLSARDKPEKTVVLWTSDEYFLPIGGLMVAVAAVRQLIARRETGRNSRTSVVNCFGDSVIDSVCEKLDAEESTRMDGRVYGKLVGGGSSTTGGMFCFDLCRDCNRILTSLLQEYNTYYESV